MATKRRVSAAEVAQQSQPKTTRPEAKSRRAPQIMPSTEEKIGVKLDAFPDRIDIRDWPYQPRLAPLPDQLIHCELVPEILDQGQEGACTGFALAAVINFLLHRRSIRRRVSPRMLYELARRYDEWPGEDYEGSSARGAMKAWVRHGVCSRTSWPDDQIGPLHFSMTIAEEAMRTPGGAFFRVTHRQVRDMHAALAEVGILYVTLMVHEGWATPGPQRVKIPYVSNGKKRTLDLPVIQRQGRADAGHAVAIVGYTAQGFIIQNSWGKGWGRNGFALLPYEDYMLHATDVWVAQLGVPVTADLWVGGAADTTMGLQRAASVIPLNEVRPYVIDVANNGELSDRGDYWTTEADLERLFGETIPQATQTWAKRRIMLYLHGGLNSEDDAARRVVAFRDVCLENEIYPLHIMWETDAISAIEDILQDHFEAANERAGGAFLKDLVEAKDRVLELTLALPGSKIWGEMKQNAQLASEHPMHKGAMQLVARYVDAAKQKLGTKPGNNWELHVVGHSAGSIFAAYAIPVLCQLDLDFKTFQLMAPAMRTDLFKERVAPHLQDTSCPSPSVYVLSDVGELDDDVGPYGKSLLYLVSNAFEGKRGTPLLGMERYIAGDAVLQRLLTRPVNGLPTLVIAGAGDKPGCVSRSATHGGFDNDPDTLNSVLYRILGQAPQRAFTARDLQY